MIIDNNHKVLYLHNPKCGGTFLRSIYKEKYGETDATKLCSHYSLKYKTDLAHTTYKDLSRIVPEYREYRIFVMIRNPYNHFVSGFKELYERLRDSLKVKIIFRLPTYYAVEFGELNKVNKLFRLLEYTLPFTKWDKLQRMQTASDLCKELSCLNKLKQDWYLRNKRIPWLNPQTEFIGPGVTVLYYELEDDWNVLLEALDLKEFADRLSIAKDYDLSSFTRKEIEKLYPEDKQIFDRYNTTF